MINATHLANAWLAIREAARTHLFDLNVSLIDVGFPVRDGMESEDLAVRFHVKRKLFAFELETAIRGGVTTPIPNSVRGFRTDVLEAGFLLHATRSASLRVGNQRAQRQDPMSGGISISNSRYNNYGTLGALVTDNVTGAPMILSNWHVLAGDWRALPGQPILQPGRLDGGRAADAVAVLTRHAMNTNLDAAVAAITGARGIISEQLGVGGIRGVGSPYLGQLIVKSGRQTEITRGRITGILGMHPMRYGGLTRIIRDTFVIAPSQLLSTVSSSGDSGSVWLDAVTGEAVGLHFAGTDLPERGLAMDLRSVLMALNVTLD